MAPATLGLLAVTPLLAIEAPPDDAPPPAELPQQQADAPAEAPVAPAAQPAYLGVVAVAVPEMLAGHLGLADGEGVLVQALSPDGPAAKAGLAAHDIITRIDGNPVASSADLTREVGKRQPGQQARLDVIHNGKAGTLDITLGARPAGLVAPAPQALDELNLDGIPNELAERIRRMIEGNLGEMQLDLERGVEQPVPQIEDAMRDMRKRMEDALKQPLQLPEIPAAPAPGGIQIHQGATFRLMDDQGSVEMKSDDGGKEITVRDKNDKILWTGPWDTEQDKAAAPDEIRRRIERLDFDNNGNGLRFQFRGGGAPVPE